MKSAAQFPSFDNDDNTANQSSLLGFYALAGHDHVMRHYDKDFATSSAGLAETLTGLNSQAQAFSLQARLILKKATTAPSLEDFEQTILNVNAYPRTGRFLGFPIDLFDKSLILKPATKDEKNCIAYQKSGASDMFNVDSRHYVVKIAVVSQTENQTRLEWSLIDHPFLNDHFEGEFASILNISKDTAVYTPDHSGYWEYNLNTRTINFGITIDIGIPVSHPKLLRKLLMVVPLALLNQNLGIGDFELMAVI
jgi:hypothetical protein